MRSNEQWLAELRGAHGMTAQRQAHEALARYLYTVAYNYLSMRQGDLSLLAALHADDLAALVQEFVQDLLEQVAARQFALLGQFRGEARLTVWAAVIMRRRIARELKKKRWIQVERLSEGGGEDEPGRPQLADPSRRVDPQFQAQLHHVAAILQGCMQTLTANERLAFTRCIAEEEPAAVVAQALQATANAVNLLVFKARRKLRTCLRQNSVDLDDLQLFFQQ
jgi:RNA polymerase sigma factor (sigma-70 family)